MFTKEKEKKTLLLMAARKEDGRQKALPTKD